MAVLFDKTKREVMITCRDGCDNGISMKFEYPYAQTPLGEEDVCWLSYVSGDFYKNQYRVWDVVKEKAKRIWLIIRSKDIYYSDVLMTRDDFEQFREFVNSVELE